MQTLLLCIILLCVTCSAALMTYCEGSPICGMTLIITILHCIHCSLCRVARLSYPCKNSVKYQRNLYMLLKLSKFTHYLLNGMNLIRRTTWWPSSMTSMCLYALHNQESLLSPSCKTNCNYNLQHIMRHLWNAVSHSLQGCSCTRFTHHCMREILQCSYKRECFSMYSARERKKFCNSALSLNTNE